jgi:hypothetical protein
MAGEQCRRTLRAATACARRFEIIPSERQRENFAEFRHEGGNWRGVHVATGHDVLDHQQILHRSNSLLRGAFV